MATTTEVQLCQLALGNIGVTALIASIVAPTSKEEKACARKYADTRDAFLESARWPFATLVATLVEQGTALYASGTTYAAKDTVKDSAGDVYVSLQAANTGHTPSTSPTWWAKISRGKWAKIYAPPANFLPGRCFLGDEEDHVAKRIEASPAGGLLLWTNDGDGVLTYVAQLTDLSTWPRLAIKALSWALSAELVTELPVEVKWLEGASRQAEMWAANALAAQFNQQTDDTEQQEDSSFLRARQ